MELVCQPRLVHPWSRWVGLVPPVFQLPIVTYRASICVEAGCIGQDSESEGGESCSVAAYAGMAS